MKRELLFKAIGASIEAGKRILEVYDTDFAVEHKDDKSPLTEADTQSHKAIMQVLENTQYPTLSEEGRDIPYEVRKSWNTFWLVDPLDGTKEFIKRNGEFTVNIALIEEQTPIMGVIYVPVQKVLYFGMEGMGAYKAVLTDTPPTLEDIIAVAQKLPATEERTFTIVGSRSHMSPETETYMNELKEKHGAVEMLSVGSSLKLCMVAEGKADEYPRFAPTMEWDTGAGHGICKAAGFKVYQHNSTEELVYNKENLLNPWFLVK